MNMRRTYESGQAIVLLVVSLVVLLGFTALAIDGGMVYSDRRHAQNAADTASLAGAGAAGAVIQNGRISVNDWSCPSILNAVTDVASDAAVIRSASNGYTITKINGINYADPDNPGLYSDPNNRVVIECIDTGTNKSLNVKTQIEAETQTSFAHIIYNGSLRNRVEAIASVKPQSPVGLGNAVVATNPLAECRGNQNGLLFTGTSVTSIEGGGALSLGCIDVDGQGNRSSIIEVIGETGVNYVGEWDGTYADKFVNGAPVQVPAPDSPDDFEVPPPNCTGLPTLTQNSDTLSQGIYSDIRLTNNQTLHLNPGLYCLTDSGNALTMNGGTFTGYGVTIYAPNGDINITGGTVNLIAPCTQGKEGVGGDPQINQCYDPGSSYPSPAIEGVVFYTNGDVTFIGNGDSSITGMIYAPKGTVTVSGTSETSPTLNTQIIAKNVFIGGTGRLVIYFDDDNTYHRPTTLNMWR
jgi:hypothetical protein